MNYPEPQNRLVAAKSNYYGVGGGTGLFEDFVQKEGYFSYTCVKTIKAGK
jgi:hypothetical protein